MNNTIEIHNLKTAFDTDKGEIICVDDVNLSIKPGEILGIVGESGCGKSVTSLSIMGLLGKNGKVIQGEILFENRNLLEFSKKEMQSIRGNKISMIFQEPMTALNPILTIGDQLTESIRLHLKMDKAEALRLSVEMLERVGLPRAEKIMKGYPHSLSGGMIQRVMIAMSLLCNPKLIIADEPTTALDVTIQAQILDLLKDIREKENTAIMFITHDLGVIAEIADRVAVMYAGQIVESADVYTLFANPKHPYTQCLMKSIPHVDSEKIVRLESIPGSVPPIYEDFSGCRFSNRCPEAVDRCFTEEQPIILGRKGHQVRCWKFKNDESMKQEILHDS